MERTRRLTTLVVALVQDPNVKVHANNTSIDGSPATGAAPIGAKEMQ